MRKLLLTTLTLVLSSAMLDAGGPPDRGERRGRRGEFLRGMIGRRGGPMFGGMFGRRGQETDVFDVARRSVDLTEELQAAIAKLDSEHAAKEREAIAEVRRRLAREYVLRIIEILPGEQKAKYKQIAAALDARDEAVAAARKKAADAEAACKKKLIELVGEEKVDVILGRARPGPQGAAPGRPRRRPEF